MDFRYLRIDKAPSPPLLKILNANIIGTPGHGMLYQHLRVEEKIDKIDDPYFVNLVRGGEIAGTCCFCSRVTLNSSQSIRSFYVRYFSFQEIFRRKSVFGKKHRSGIIRVEVEALLNGKGLNVASGERFFFYAYVDPRNKRSALLCEEFGFETVRQYTTILFSRIKPRENKMISVEEIQPDDAIKTLLKDFYFGYNMLSFENLEGRKYYVVKDSTGEPVAGVMANPDAWKIHSLPGTAGKLKLTVFSNLPFLNKLVNKDFRFLTFEAVYVKPGFENKLESLLESLLFRYHLNCGICLVDANSKLYATLKTLNLGLAQKLSKEVRGNLICRFSDFSPLEREQFKSLPAYLSTTDAA